jgi:N-acyl-D-amino-acid deacylase
VVTDGAGFPGPSDLIAGQLNNKIIHPRCFGSFPKFLRLVRETNAISLSEAIAKITSVPAGLIGLDDRGIVAIGKKADLVIFNPSSITDSATNEQPYLPPKGIDYVLNNGQVTLEKSVLLKNSVGKFLNKS